MLEYIKGDAIQALENGDITVLAHACNHTVGMGAGIAKSIADKYPVVDSYDKEYGCGGWGTSVLEVGPNKAVLNSYCMMKHGKPTPNTNDSYEARLKRFKADLEEYTDAADVVGIPLVLSGLAKHDRSISDLEYFKKYIAPELESYNLKVYYL